ncbi:MAG: hypothetical protein K8R36_01870 [Planctomycetales bacterium]|nr:hypothetical protein [Planctomycetales bacterium]
MKRISLHLLFIGVVVALSLPASFAYSQADVVQAAKDAGKGFVPIAAQDVAAAKAELQAAVALPAFVMPCEVISNWRLPRPTRSCRKPTGRK